MQQREQQFVEGSVDAPLTVEPGGAARADDDQRRLAGEESLPVTERPPVRCVQAVGVTLDEDPVEPALEDRGHLEPPQRELDDERVRPVELVLLGPDVGAQRAVAVGALRGGRDMEPFGGIVGVVRGVDDGVPAHRVEVRDLDLVAGVQECAPALGGEEGGEGTGIGVGHDPENVHGVDHVTAAPPPRLAGWTTCAKIGP